MVRESNFFLLLVVISLFVVGIVLAFRAYRRGAGS
jgi:cbb3-type cytochrome oxidase subunit 3